MAQFVDVCMCIYILYASRLQTLFTRGVIMNAKIKIGACVCIFFFLSGIEQRFLFFFFVSLLSKSIAALENDVGGRRRGARRVKGNYAVRLSDLRLSLRCTYIE